MLIRCDSHHLLQPHVTSQPLPLPQWTTYSPQIEHAISLCSSAHLICSTLKCSILFLQNPPHSSRSKVQLFLVRNCLLFFTYIIPEISFTSSYAYVYLLQKAVTSWRTYIMWYFCFLEKFLRYCKFLILLAFCFADISIDLTCGKEFSSDY